MPAGPPSRMQPAPVNNRKNTGPPRPRTVSTGLVLRSIAARSTHRSIRGLCRAAMRLEARGRISMRRSQRVAGRVAASSSPHLRVSTCQQRSLLRSRGAFLRPGSLFLCRVRPMRGGRSAETAQYFSCRAHGRDGRACEARRASSGTRSPLGAPPWRFSAGGRASISGISSGSVQRCSSQPGRSAWRAGSRTSRGRRLRAAAAGRHSPPGLQDRL
jgi:hypothetical protein